MVSIVKRNASTIIRLSPYVVSEAKLRFQYFNINQDSGFLFSQINKMHNLLIVFVSTFRVCDVSEQFEKWRCSIGGQQESINFELLLLQRINQLTLC